MKLKKGSRRTKLDYSYLKSEWANEQFLRVGYWLYSVLVDAFDVVGKDGHLDTPDDWRRVFADAREELMRRHPVMLPHDKPPPPWKSWRTRYDKRLSQTFVSDWKKETRGAIEAAFKKPFPHADAVNALQNVALELDPVMVDLAKQFAAQLMNTRWKECKPKCRCKKCRQARLNVELVKADVATARLTSKRCWLGYCCDYRGRVNATQHLNYQREDHVHSMFRFANGQPLGEDGLYWLEIHTANCAGSIRNRLPSDKCGSKTIWR
jgi:DNA-directed RNA polymerase